MKKILIISIVLIFFIDPSYAEEITKPHTFTPGTSAKASEVNENFDAIYDQVNKVGGAVSVDDSGNVDIGATSPDASLQIKGTTRAFGEWESKSPDTVYQAPTDGFVIVNPHSAGSDWGYFSVYTDPENPPTIERTKGNTYNPAGSRAGATIPVRKGDYWKVATTHGDPPDAVWWIPLGL